MRLCDRGGADSAAVFDAFAGRAHFKIALAVQSGRALSVLPDPSCESGRIHHGRLLVRIIAARVLY